MNPKYFHVVKKPLVTEKATQLTAEFNQYVFEVERNAVRPEIKKEIQDSNSPPSQT